jgi:hypothetical protein
MMAVPRQQSTDRAYCYRGEDTSKRMSDINGVMLVTQLHSHVMMSLQFVKRKKLREKANSGSFHSSNSDEPVVYHIERVYAKDHHCYFGGRSLFHHRHEDCHFHCIPIRLTRLTFLPSSSWGPAYFGS